MTAHDPDALIHAMKHTMPHLHTFARHAAMLALVTGIAACASSSTPASVTPAPTA